MLIICGMIFIFFAGFLAVGYQMTEYIRSTDLYRHYAETGEKAEGKDEP